MVGQLARWVYYGLVLPVGGLAAKAAAARDAKVREALEGRRLPLERAVPEGSVSLWFHVSSLGEFEQARPVIEAVGARHPAAAWVSFFSPSGLRHARGYPHAKDMFYLPLRRGDLGLSFKRIAPRVVVVVGSDLWPGMVWEANARGIPVILVDATLRPDSPRNRTFLRPLQRSFYRGLARVLAVTEEDAEGLRRLCGPGVPVEVAGDSRYDRVWQRATGAPAEEGIAGVVGSAPRPLVVVGSSYEPEERVLAEALGLLGGGATSLGVVVVPHEPSEERLRFAEELFGGVGFVPRRASRLSPGEPWRLLLLDRVGVLAESYRHADFVVVGGSFKRKVHNVMEPAAWGKPIIVGPHYTNSPEAVGMVECGGITPVRDAADLARTLREWMGDARRAAERGRRAQEFLTSRLGASMRIADAIEACLHASEA